MASNLFNKYIWLVDTIYQAGKITFADINDKWVRNDMSEGEEIPLRTFHNHRRAIEEMFDINIECNHSTNEYFIENAGDMKDGSIRTWLLNTFSVNNLIKAGHNLKKRIIFEEIPSGQRFLAPIIEAMRDGVQLEMTYQSYRKDYASTFPIEPYCVKIFKQRWYMVAFNPGVKDNPVRVYALDRIQNLKAIKTKFKYPKSFDPEAYFEDSFGIIVGNEDEETECVVLKTNPLQAKYFRALPLHRTQEEVENTPKYSVFRLFVKPTYDFKQELLSYGANVEVLEPASLREDIAKQLQDAAKLYKEKK